MSDYVPAAGRHGLLFTYDPLTRLLGVGALHRQMIEQAGLGPNVRVLEIGCGTGNLTAAAARTGARVTGLDPDARALARARRKHAGVSYDVGFAQSLPYEDGSFDRVLSSLMFHHLTPEIGRAMMAEAARVLAPGGSVHVADFASAPRFFHDQGNFGRVREAMLAAGLGATETGRRRTLLGPVTFHRGG